MSLARSWGAQQAFEKPKRALKEQRGVYQLKRPKSLAEVNRWRQTPYTRRVCWGCRKELFSHWYLVFLDAIKCSRLYCYKDGTAYFFKEKFRI